MILKADQWIDYSCLDAGNGEKLEQWKGVILRRPDHKLSGQCMKINNGRMQTQSTIEVIKVEEAGNTERSFQNPGQSTIVI